MSRMPFHLKRGLEFIKEDKLLPTTPVQPKGQEEPFVDPTEGQTDKTIGAFLKIGVVPCWAARRRGPA